MKEGSYGKFLLHTKSSKPTLNDKPPRWVVKGLYVGLTAVPTERFFPEHAKKRLALICSQGLTNRVNNPKG